MDRILPKGDYDHQGEALSKSLLNFVNFRGKSFTDRYSDLNDWLVERRKHDVCPYFRVVISQIDDEVAAANETGLDYGQCLNFGSQDYLGLTLHSQITEAAKTCIDEYGIHAAGSAILTGRSTLTMQLEERLAKILRQDQCLLFPTGWMAGFGVVTSMVRPRDTIIMDSLIHNCLSTGAQQSTKNINKFKHNDVNHLEELLIKAREKNSVDGLFILTETLFSMDSDSPDLGAILALADRYEANVIVDVAHDFAAMGDEGLGLLESIKFENRENLVIIGSLSKSLATNGGFVAGPASIRDCISVYSPTYVFSTGFTPMQAKIGLTCLDIAFSNQGKSLRKKLMKNTLLLREGLTANGFKIAGTPSPIAPVFVDGDERLARLISKYLFSNRVLANLVEFPAVPKGKARFRFQMMASHQEKNIAEACNRMVKSREEALIELLKLDSLNQKK